MTQGLFVTTELAKNKGVQKRIENNDVGKIYKRAFLISPSTISKYPEYELSGFATAK